MGTPEISDEALVQKVRDEGPLHFEALMRRHNPRVYRIVRSVLRSEAEVEDVMQDAYVLAFSHLGELTTAQSFATWLRTIAFNEALRRARRERGSPFMEADLATLESPSSLPTPEANAGDAQLKVAMERAVDALPDGYREVFMLRTVEGCSIADTAQVLGIEEATVKTRLFRARAHLQDALSGWVEREAPATFAFHATRCDRVVAAVLARLKDTAQ